MFFVCYPACHDSSLYLFVLVLFLEAVALSHVYVAFNIFYQHIVNVIGELSVQIRIMYLIRLTVYCIFSVRHCIPSHGGRR